MDGLQLLLPPLLKDGWPAGAAEWQLDRKERGRSAGMIGSSRACRSTLNFTLPKHTSA